MLQAAAVATKHDLQDWVVEALKAHGGAASILDISKHVWTHHERELRESGDLFFTWQYDLRWAGQVLRDHGVLSPAAGRRTRVPWSLASV